MAVFPKQSASRQGAVQAVTYSGTAGAFVGFFGGETYQLRLVANSACHYLISGGNAATPTAATAANGSFLPANWVEYVTVTPGQSLSVVQAATNGLITATAGTLNVTEMS